MPTTVTIHDQTPAGDRTHSFTLDFLSTHVTVRQLIRSRVYQEVQDHNARKSDTFQGLVQPAGSHPTPDGFKLPKPRDINWKTQFEKALEGFQKSAFHILVDGQQLARLDDEVDLNPNAQITFIKHSPIIGG
jgi:hypothetical protein